MKFLKKPFSLVVILGVVSLFADITYEGARSITGFFFAELSAPAFAVGVVGGLGEFISFALRILSGFLADKTGRYWLLLSLGYSLTFVSVPALSLVGRWEFASVPIILERLGKAIRSPARDTIISFASHRNLGKGFAIHEFLDQIGAIAGPLLVSAVLHFLGIRNIFLLLGIPALFSFMFLFVAYRLFPKPREIKGVDEVKLGGSTSPAQGNFLSIFFIFILVQVAGFPHFQFVSYHLSDFMSGSEIAFLFAVAMGVDALAGLIWGIIYDRIGSRVLFAVPPLTFLSTLFFFNSPYLGVVLWGAVLGFYETSFKSAISEFSGVEKRGVMFGLFHAVFGLGWLFGSSAMGLLYPDISKIILFSLLCQLVSVFMLSFFFFLRRGTGFSSS